MFEKKELGTGLGYEIDLGVLCVCVREEML